MTNDELREQLEDRLYERMAAENEAYLADIKSKPIDEVIQSAYQIAWRENMLYLFEDETPLTVRQLEVLSELEQPMAELYDHWLDRDTHEMDLLRECLKSHADQILKHRAEEKYSDPAQPLYAKSVREAIACGELLEWRCDHRRSEECARLFRQDASIAYNGPNFPAFLERWTAAYGKERCMLVLAGTIQQRKEDARFSLTARQAAAQYAPRLAADSDHIWDYVVNTHSCIVNAAMEHLTKPERQRAHTEKRKQSKANMER